MKRREMIQLGAAAPVAAAAAGLPSPLPAAAQAAAHAAAWQPALFDAHQNETVIALTELILPRTDTPGAKDALVNRYLDLLLRDGPDEPRRLFLEGLGWLDGFALRRHGKPFVACDAAGQTEMLRALSDGKEPGIETGTRFFRAVKGWTTRIYYATQAGFQELNKGGRVPANYGCPHPDRHA